MSQTQSTTQRDYPDSPFRRDNHYGDEDLDEDRNGHQELTGTDAAEYVAFSQLQALTEPVCGRAKEQLGKEIPLSDPCLYLPKQIEIAGRIIQYGQHRHRRRINIQTGWINWGESTSTDIPEVDEETFMTAVHNYLAEREHHNEGQRIDDLDDALETARRLFRSQDLNSTKALTIFVRKVRDGDFSN